MKKLSHPKSALHLAVTMALALAPLASNAIVHTQEEKLEHGGYISNVTGTVNGITHLYSASTGVLLDKNSPITSIGSLAALTINIGTDEATATVKQNFSGIFLDHVPESAGNAFTLEGPLTININQGSFIQANLYALNDSVSGTAPTLTTDGVEQTPAQFFTLTADDININIKGNDNPDQKEGSVYGYYANSGSYVNTVLKNITITVSDAEEASEDSTSTGGIYGIPYSKNNSTLTAGDIQILVKNGYDGKGTYGYHSEQNLGNNSTVTLNSITLLAEDYQGADGYLRGIEKQGNEALTVKGDVSVTGYNVTEGRITGVFSRGGDIDIGGSVQLYIRDVQDGNPGEDNMTGIWLARGGSVNVAGSVVVSYVDDSSFTGTFDQNITGIGIMKVDHVGDTTTATTNASVTVGGNLIVQLAGDAQSIGLKNHTVYGAVNNGGSTSNITFADGGQRYLFFGTDTSNGTDELAFSSLNSEGQNATFQGSFSNFDAIVVSSGSSLYLGAGQTLGLAGDDDLFQTTQVKENNKVVGFAPVLNFVDFLNGKRNDTNVSAGVIDGIVSMGGVLSMASNTSMDIREGGLANIWLLQNENGANIRVDGSLELYSTSISAEAVGSSTRVPGSGTAYNKGNILGNGKLLLQATTPTGTLVYDTYTYNGKHNTTEVTADNSTFVNSGTIGIATLEIGNGFHLQNTGNIYVDNLTATHAFIDSTGTMTVFGTMELTGTEVTSTHPISAGNIILNGSTIEVEDSPAALVLAAFSGETVKSSVINTTKPIQTSNLVLNYSTLTSSSTVTVSENLSVGSRSPNTNQGGNAGSLQIDHSELEAESIAVSGSLTASHAEIDVTNTLYAGSLQVANSTLDAQGSIAVAGNITITDSKISAFTPGKSAGIALATYDIDSTPVFAADESITVSNSSIDTNLPIVAKNLDLSSSQFKTNESISVAGTINVTNDATVTSTGPITATTLAITGASDVNSNGNITTSTLTVNDGSLVSGENSKDVSIRTNDFTFNKGEVHVNNGTFEAYQSASLKGGTFVLGSDSTTAEVQLNPTASSKSATVNLNTGFDINAGSKLGLGTQSVLSDAKTVFGNLDMDTSSKTVLAVNKAIVTGNTGYINVGYANPNVASAIALVASEAAGTNTTETSNGLHFGSDSILAIAVNDNSVVPNKSSSSVFTTTASNTPVVVDSGATVVLYGNIQPGHYNITKGYGIGDQTVNGWNHENEGEVVVYVKDAANLDWTYERGTYLKSDGYDNDYVWLDVISHQDVQEVYPDISIPDISNDAFDNCRSRSGEFICGIFRDDQLDADQKTEIINTASAIAFTGGVMAVAMNDLNYGFGAMYKHLTMDSDTFAAQGKLWPGEENNNFWLDVIGHWTQSKHLSATGIKDIGYRDSTYGFILGYDHKIENHPFVVGVAFSYLDGQLKSNGDIVRTTNKHQSYGAHFYANYSPNEHLNLIGSLHWMRNNADLNELINTSAAKSANATAHTDMFAIGLRAETTLSVGPFNFIPHIEPRYIYGKTRNFSTKIDSNKVWDTSFGGNSLFQVPVGVALRTDIKTESGWNWRPTLDVQVIPQVGSTSQKMKIKNSGGVSNQIYGQYQGKFAAEAKFGMSVDKGPWTFGVNYGFGGGLKGRYEHGFNFEGRFRW